MKGGGGKKKRENVYPLVVHVEFLYFNFQKFSQIPHQCNPPSCILFLRRYGRVSVGFNLKQGSSQQKMGQFTMRDPWDPGANCPCLSLCLSSFVVVFFSCSPSLLPLFSLPDCSLLFFDHSLSVFPLYLYTILLTSLFASPSPPTLWALVLPASPTPPHLL